MIHLVDKRLGETPLEAMKRLKIEGKATYAGRLDPMADGELLVLTGEDIGNKERYLDLDKEYEATFVLAVSTDTGDLLGLITKVAGTAVAVPAIESSIKSLKDIQEQTYPWFSSKTVDGTPLFEHYKSGNTDIDRPVREVEIKEVEILENSKISTKELKKYVFDSIALVKGDFRQEEVLDKWQECLGLTSTREFVTVKVRLRVSSGTYIRGLTENLEESLGIPVVLMKLKRTKVFLEEQGFLM